MSNIVRDMFGNQYRLVTDKSEIVIIGAVPLQFNDIDNANRFVRSLDVGESTLKRLIYELGGFPFSGEDLTTILAGYFLINAAQAYSVPAQKLSSNDAKKTIKPEQGPALYLASPLDPNIAPNKVKRLNGPYQASEYAKLFDVTHSEVIEVIDNSSISKDQKCADLGPVEKIAKCLESGELILVEQLGPKALKESLLEEVLGTIPGNRASNDGPVSELCGTCKVSELTVQCSHGRKPGPSNVLQVVAEPKTTTKQGYTFMGASLDVERSYGGEEKITSELNLDGKKFDSCPVLTTDGCSSNDESSELVLTDQTSKSSKRWTGNETPKTYVISGSSCTNVKSVRVEMFSCSVYSLEINVEAFHKLTNDLNDKLKEWSSNIFGASPIAIIPEVKLPAGHCKVSWGWKENSDWRVYHFVKADFGLNPIFGVSLKFEISMLKLAGAAAAIPPVVTKYLSEYIADIFVTPYISFDQSLTGSPNYRGFTDGDYKLVGEAIRTTKGALGISLSARFGHETIFSIRASVEAETQVVGEDKLEVNSDGIFTEGGVKVQPLICRVVVVKKYFKLAGKPKSKEWKPWGNKAIDIFPSKREKFFPND